MRSLVVRSLRIAQAQAQSRSSSIHPPWTSSSIRSSANHHHNKYWTRLKSSTTKSKRQQSTTSAEASTTTTSSRLRTFMLQPRTISVPRYISPRYYTVTVSEMCGHASFILVAISYAVDNFLELRIIAVAGSAVMLCFTYFHPHGRVLWLPFRWNALFIAINSYRIGKVMLDRYYAEQLSPEFLKLRDSHFYVLDPPDFYKLVRLGKLETYEPGDLVVAQGDMNRYIRLVIEGEFNILRDGQLTYMVEEGNFLSETGLHAGLLLPGRVESCCSVVASSSNSNTARVLSWERNELMDLLHRETQLRRALKAVSSWDIVRKLKSQRYLLSSGKIPDPENWTVRRTNQSQHRYAAILQNMLYHPKYLKERKAELEKYRLIHHIDDVDHQVALARNGWTVEDFERGYKEGEEQHQQQVEEQDGTKRQGLQWIAHDVYMRLFG